MKNCLSRFLDLHDSIQVQWCVLLLFGIPLISNNIFQEKLIAFVGTRIKLREKPSYIPLAFIQKYLFKVCWCQLFIRILWRNKLIIIIGNIKVTSESLDLVLKLLVYEDFLVSF